MNEILSRAELTPNVIKITVAASEIAAKARAGQFVVVIPAAKAERIPLTIADSDREKGTITIIFQLAGATTRLLASLQVGDQIPHVL
ncbi:MAG: sulfide/dihydroorotate dehydrogenase-like FAD/NAD-binding protein, partial [Candidatus Margulisbacteria bacterium]|nr:sulfide/dihydroorotate dehydrogenase-like FAD/NAD-binding protein [Candidatus Margulisiibacteriota bacterium]